MSRDVQTVFIDVLVGQKSHGESYDTIHDDGGM